jgi:hypothetical protein
MSTDALTQEAAQQIAATNAANAKEREERHAANAKAKEMISAFIGDVKSRRPSIAMDGIGQHLDQMITAGIDLMATYFEDQFRDYYDARKDI